MWLFFILLKEINYVSDLEDSLPTSSLKETKEKSEAILKSLLFSCYLNMLLQYFNPPIKGSNPHSEQEQWKSNWSTLRTEWKYLGDKFLYTGQSTSTIYSPLSTIYITLHMVPFVLTCAIDCIWENSQGHWDIHTHPTYMHCTGSFQLWTRCAALIIPELSDHFQL